MANSTLKILLKELSLNANSKKALQSAKFFKTGPGDYAEGEKFLGIYTPDLRSIVKKFPEITLNEILDLLQAEFHEEKLAGVFALVFKYKQEPKKVFDFYIKHSKLINNWDLVDQSAHYILGDYLLDKNRSILYQLAKSKNLWQRRIAVVACMKFIKADDFEDILKLAVLLIEDDHDLMHKAIGWMLREVGKRDIKVLKKFLDNYTTKMPRTTLRYAIEKMPEKQRKGYLKL